MSDKFYQETALEINRMLNSDRELDRLVKLQASNCPNDLLYYFENLNISKGVKIDKNELHSNSGLIDKYSQRKVTYCFESYLSANGIKYANRRTNKHRYIKVL